MPVERKKKLGLLLGVTGILTRVSHFMQILNRWSERRVVLSSTRRYYPEEIRNLCWRIVGPFWLQVGDTDIPLPDERSLLLACQICAAYHNDLAYNVHTNDNFERDMAEREAIVQARMEEPSSEEDDPNDYVTEEEDIVYEKECYI
jgi:hypothetical protein